MVLSKTKRHLSIKKTKATNKIKTSYKRHKLNNKTKGKYKCKTKSRYTFGGAPIKIEKMNKDKLSRLLSNCKSLEHNINNKLRSNVKRQYCKYGEECNRVNPLHIIEYSHPNELHIKQLLINSYKQCTDHFLDISWHLFRDNNDMLPTSWYSAIFSYLREIDYNKQTSLYFNILANICQHYKEYLKLYSKQFFKHLLTGMEESSVTGMFDITNNPNLVSCLKKMNSPDKRYLSNTALLAIAK